MNHLNDSDKSDELDKRDLSDKFDESDELKKEVEGEIGLTVGGRVEEGWVGDAGRQGKVGRQVAGGRE